MLIHLKHNIAGGWVQLYSLFLPIKVGYGISKIQNKINLVELFASLNLILLKLYEEGELNELC